MSAQVPRWGDRWQDEVYRLAAQRLPPHVYRHFTQGAREGVSQREAQRVWGSHRFVPHVLRGGPVPELTTHLLGSTFASPIGIAPTSLKTYADPDGDIAMARAAVATDTLLVVSSNTGQRFEEIAATGVAWWLQLYLTEERELIRPLIEEAAVHGARAVVLTVDTPYVGTRYDADPGLFTDVVERINHTAASRDRALSGAHHARDLSAADIGWVAEASGLPVVLKGVLGAHDARRGVHHGAAAIWVSNHGGRQLDRTVAPATALPAVVEAVESEAEVYVDGGLHNGLDTLVALALGARGVFLGRLPLLALGAGGESAVVAALRTLRDELAEAMELSGCSCAAEARDLLIGALREGRGEGENLS